MTRKAILQIGTEKTGTTTLQTFLSVNRARLAQAGFAYPRFCGEINHTGLAAYAMEDGRSDPLKQAFGVFDPADVPSMRARMREAARAELDGGLTAIFCSEHCHSRLIHDAEVIRLREFLSEFFDDIRISVYLRRQDQIALSLYSTMLKSGGAPGRILNAPAPDDPYYNYDRFLSLWERVFGREAVSVRIFERAELAGGSIVDDFLAQWSIGPVSAFHGIPNENGSISQEAQEFLRLVNPHLETPPGVPIEVLRGPIVARLAKCFPGRGARPARAEAEAFYETYRAANEAVAARHFPGRVPLFSEDFSAYPEVEDAPLPGTEALARVAARMLMERAGDIERLEGEIAIREAALCWRDDRPEDALRTLREAQGRLPRHPGLRRSLGEYLFRLRRIEESLAAARAACTLAPDNWEFRHFLGIVLSASSEHAAAVEAQRQALALKPDHPGIVRALQVALAQCPPGAGATA